MRIFPRLAVGLVLAISIGVSAMAQPRVPGNDQSPPGGSPSPSPGGGGEQWGAIAFTADGSYSTTWQKPSKAEAEATVLRACAKFGRGACEVSALPNSCIGLTSFRGGRWRLAWTAGGTTHPEAQRAAMNRCETDDRTRRSRNRCTFRISICGDGR